MIWFQHAYGSGGGNVLFKLIEWVPGAANEDRKVNQLDLVQMLQRGKYRTGEFSVRSDGDFGPRPAYLISSI